MSKERNSNFELMRIISMLFIILGHSFFHGKIVYHVDEGMKLFIYFIYAIIFVHVNSFVLVSGYYQCKSTFKASKAFKLFGVMYFYHVLSILIALIFDLRTFSCKTELLWEFTPFAAFSYWYINIYLILYFLSPFINKLIRNMSKKNFLSLIIVMFVFGSILTRFTMQGIFNNSNGYSIFNFILLYLIGAYLREYPLKEISFKKMKFLNNKRNLYFAVFCGCFILRYFINYIGYKMTFMQGGFVTLGGILSYGFDKGYYDIPLLIIQSVAYFLFFSTLNIKNYIVNKFAKPVIEVYLFHDNSSLRPVIYTFLGLTLDYYTFSVIPFAIAISLVLFMMGFFLYYIRTYLFNMLSKLWIFKKIGNGLNNLYVKIDNCLNE